MNWKRGFLRAWLLMTGLWLALNVVFFRPDVEVQIYWKFHEVAAVGAQPAAPKDPTVDTTINQPPTTGPQKSKAGSITRQLLSGRRQDKSIPDIKDLSDEALLELAKLYGIRTKENLGLRAKENLKIFALTAFLPPAILFVIGAGGLWVFRGFRRGDA